MKTNEQRIETLERKVDGLAKVLVQIAKRLGLKLPAAGGTDAEPVPAAAAPPKQGKHAGPYQWWMDPAEEKALGQAQHDFARMGEGEQAATIWTADGRQVPGFCPAPRREQKGRRSTAADP